MARKLRVFQTSLGFFELAIAAPSMKAALDAWGADSNLFHQGAARESTDPDVIASTMAKPGVILRRAVGSDGAFKERAELPASLSAEAPAPSRKKSHANTRKQVRREPDDRTTREAAKAFEKQQRVRDSERRKQEAARKREHERRQRAIAGAQRALQEAEREHDSRASSIQAERAALEQRSAVENERWARQKVKLETDLRRARE